MIQIDLPWPARDLHPNARPHRATKAREVKKARNYGFILASPHRNALKGAGAVQVIANIYPPNGRGHDLDGVFASLKAAIDGIADCLGFDDRNIRKVELTKYEPDKTKKGKIVLFLTVFDIKPP